MRRHPLLPIVFSGCMLAVTLSAARAAEPVDVSLVLVDDVSRSIDDSEFRLQKHGYEEAFADPEVIAALKGGTFGAIAVSYVEFASEGQVQTVVPWTVVRDADTAHAFAEAVVQAPRSYYGRTAIGAGIDQAMQLLRDSPYSAQRRVIDVCGDGTSNAGRDVTAARDDAVAAGVTINGLAIINDHPVSWTYAHVQPPGGLAAYYRQNVTGGPGTFVIEIHDFKAFSDAIRHKLISEIASAGNPLQTATR